MSRSRRKTPVFKNTTADSDKRSKQICNRKLRGITKNALKHYDPDSDDDLILPEAEEVHDVWNFESDGKKYIGKNNISWERGPDKRDMDK